MAPRRALARSVLADQVRDQLLEWILSGRYEPDARIVETQVARELGTSQAPVREALIALEAVGIVEISPFRGARVRRPSPPRDPRGVWRSLGAGDVRRTAGRPAHDRRPSRRARGLRRADGACRARGDGHAVADGTLASTSGSSSWPTTAPWSGRGAGSSPTRGRTSASSPQAPTRRGRRTSTHPSSRRLRARDADAVANALAALRGGRREHGRPLAGSRADDTEEPS